MSSTTDREPGRLSRLLAVPAELLLGAACHGCDLPGLGLCPDCRARLHSAEPGPTTPSPSPAGFPPTVAAGPYDELLRRLISAHKERQAWSLSGVLAERLAGAVERLLQERPASAVALVPIPSDPSAVRRRGRDATAAIAARAASRMGTRSRPVAMLPILRGVRSVADQTDLNAVERQRNLAGAYAVRSRAVRRLGAHPDVRVVLVDDLVTTGASLAEAHRAAAAVDLDVVGAAVIAATVLRRQDRATPDPRRSADSSGC